MLVYREDAEAEAVTPPPLVLHEVEVVQEAPDWYLDARQEVDPSPPRLEPRVHVDLERLVVRNLANCGEGLQRHPVGVVGLRGVEDDPVAARHPLQRVRLAVIGLSEPAGDAALDVSTADGVDPVRHDGHAGTRRRWDRDAMCGTCATVGPASAAAPSTSAA